MGLCDPRLLSAQREKFGRLSALIEAAREIVICAHTDPDGDALGSGLALAQIISSHWEGKRVTNLLADDAEVPRLYRFLPGSERFVCPCDYAGAPDLFIVVDLSAAPRLMAAQEILARAARCAIIDHHPCAEPFGEVALIRPEAAATGVIIAEYALYLGVDITPNMADCLFCAIVTDTGRFQYQNTDPEAFECASMLVGAGASPARVSLNVYQSFRLSFLHLESVVMGRITTFEHGRIAYSYATRSDMSRTGADPGECDGLIDMVRSVEGSELALFLKELPSGQVRGNLRSKGEHDISGVARAMGGGGHKAAAGFTTNEGIDATFATVLPMLREVLAAGPDPAGPGPVSPQLALDLGRGA